ncbi:hypothetical protein [Halorientalis brevis]|uniref:hypothetical protein n=1 Tax=Halorientalis brevis TaxID=1126241 RepID=UPI001FF9C16C|nr:hypothetical protein [Halorientalis brevis]
MSSTPERDNTEQQLARVCEALGIPESTARSARERFDGVRSVTVLEDKRNAAIGAAVLSLTTREDGLPITVANIADTWSKTLSDQPLDPDEITSLFGVLTANLDFQGTPPQPRALIERFGTDLGLPDGIIVVANRILVDVFTQDPEMIAEGTSPDGIAGSILYLAAKLNGYDDLTESDISDTLGTGQFTVQNRSKKLRDALGKERLANDDRYHLHPETGVPKSNEPAPSDPGSGDPNAKARPDGSADSPAATDEDADESTTAADDQASDSQTETEAGADEAEDADSEDDPAAAPEDEQDDATAADDDESAADGDDADAVVTGDGEFRDIEAVVQSLFPDELPTTEHVAAELDVPIATAQSALESAAADGDIDQKEAGSTVVWLPGDRSHLTPDLTEDAVQNEVDELAEELDLSASLRVFARGLVSDAVDTLSVEDANEMAGAAVQAASRIQDVDVEAADIAAAGEFEVRMLHTWLDRLAETVAVEIPRSSPESLAEEIAASLDLDETVREEGLRALEQYEPRDDDLEYTASELAAGGMFFAATVGGAPVDLDELGSVSGADPEYIEDAMNSILVSLCLALVRGELAYEETPWTGDLLESDLSQDFGDIEVEKAIALAKTHVAGRESQAVDEATIDVLLQE